MGRQLEPSIVAVLDQDGDPCGMGFLVAPDLVCTCAHVVCDALGLPREAHPPHTDKAIHLRFVFFQQTVFATLETWIPIATDETVGDIAILRLSMSPPAGAGAVRRYFKFKGDISERDVRAYGYPDRGNESRGRWAKAITAGRSPCWVQLEDTKVTGFRILPGYSGSAVWDIRASGVIGMVVAYDRDPNAKVAFMLPIEAIAEKCPQLALPIESINPSSGVATGSYTEAAYILPSERREQLLALVESATWPSSALYDAYDLSRGVAERALGGDASLPLVRRMLLSLATSVRSSDNILPILAFVWRLVEIAKQASPELLDLSPRLSDWFHAAAKYLRCDASLIEVLKERVGDEIRQRRELHVAIVLIKGTGDRYLVRAWRVLVGSERKRWVDEDARQLEVEDRSYTADEIPIMIQSLIIQLADDIARAGTVPIVEIFVPMSGLLWDADQWTLDLGLGQIRLGVEYRVVVRSWERAYTPGGRLIYPKWEACWSQLDKTPPPIPWGCTQEEVGAHETGLRFPVDVSPSMALFFAPSRDQSTAEYPVLRKLLVAGIPIAVWPRKDHFHGPRLAQILKDLVSSKPVVSWRETVQQYRKEAEGRQDDPGSHLTVLWDDPNKLLPDALGRARGQQMSKG